MEIEILFHGKVSEFREKFCHCSQMPQSVSRGTLLRETWSLPYQVVKAKKS